MFYEDVFRELNKRKVRYLVIGGVALVLHGVVRLTADLDLMLNMNSANLFKFITAMKKMGYKPKVPVKPEDFADLDKRRKWKQEKGMEVFSFFHPQKPFQTVDILLGQPVGFKEAYGERKIAKARGIRISLISVKHLKKLKRAAGREQDLADIKALNKLERLNKRGKQDEK